MARGVDDSLCVPAAGCLGSHGMTHALHDTISTRRRVLCFESLFERFAAVAAGLCFCMRYQNLARLTACVMKVCWQCHVADLQVWFHGCSTSNDDGACRDQAVAEGHVTQVI